MSLVPWLLNPAKHRAQAAIIVDEFKNKSVRDKRYRYILYNDGSEEFYDHLNDQNERTNQIHNSNYTSKIKRLNSQLPTSRHQQRNGKHLSSTLRPIHGETKRLELKYQERELQYNPNMNRRAACKTLALSALAPQLLSCSEKKFNLRYVLSSAMYGKMPLADILPEIKKTGSESIDIWRKVHANHREQIEEMGDNKAHAIMQKHNAKISISTCYPLGPLGLQEEMNWLKGMGGSIIVTGAGRHPDQEPSGEAAKIQVKSFLEKMKPHVAKAEETGITIAVENHDKQLLYHPDSLRYFAEFNKSPNLGIAFALHHLHKYVSEIPGVIKDLGNEQIPFIYFQEHSAGIREKQPKEIEMQQMPGFGGGLDYRPIASALREIDYQGLVEIFMHPVPRGIPILPTISEITGAINQSRNYIEDCFKETA